MRNFISALPCPPKLTEDHNGRSPSYRQENHQRLRARGLHHSRILRRAPHLYVYLLQPSQTRPRPRRGACAGPGDHHDGSGCTLEKGSREGDDTSVTNEVAKIVTADHRVLSVGDALFKNIPGQAWRYVEY